MPYWKTVVRVEILSDGEKPPVFDDLSTIHEAITHGGCSGMVDDEGTRELSRLECIAALIEQGSDPAFLVMDYELCTECEEPHCPGVITCSQCGVGEHGVAAETHVADHGYCRECLRKWQMGEGDE